MLKIDLCVTRRVGREQLLTIGLPAFIDRVAHGVRQVKHHVDALRGVVIPGCKNEQVRTIGDLRLVPRFCPDSLAKLRVLDHDNFEWLKAARCGGQARRFDNPIHLVLGHWFGWIHFLGGVTPLQFFEQFRHG